MRPASLVLAMCAGQVGSLLPHMAFAALIPRFATLWGLSATESGAISGAFFFGYAAVVPLATTLTALAGLPALRLGAATSAGTISAASESAHRR